VPSNAVSLAEAYRKSETYHRMKAERDEYNERMAADPTNRNDFMAAVAEDKRKGVSAKSPYTVSFPMQVAALTKRQFQLKRQDKFGLYTGYFTSIGESSERERSVEPRLTHPLAALTVIAIISGTVYLQLPQTSAGAFTRGGAIFIAMLFNALNAFSELPTQMMGRPILFKQVNYSYYRPGALAIASNFAELPFVRRSDLVLLAPSCAISPFTPSSIEPAPDPHLLVRRGRLAIASCLSADAGCSIIIYFMAALERSAGAFFICAFDATKRLPCILVLTPQRLQSTSSSCLRESSPV
jgi:hypothetical protein